MIAAATVLPISNDDNVLDSSGVSAASRLIKVPEADSISEFGKVHLVIFRLYYQAVRQMEGLEMISWDLGCGTRVNLHDA